jgi:hypothetical protein
MCPVCGFPQFTPYDEFGAATYEICPSCGCEAGNEYDHRTNESHYRYLRKHWLHGEKGRWWCSFEKPPEDWNHLDQMKNAGIEIPE